MTIKIKSLDPSMHCLQHLEPPNEIKKDVARKEKLSFEENIKKPQLLRLSVSKTTCSRQELPSQHPAQTISRTHPQMANILKFPTAHLMTVGQNYTALKHRRKLTNLRPRQWNPQKSYLHRFTWLANFKNAATTIMCINTSLAIGVMMQPTTLCPWFLLYFKI